MGARPGANRALVTDYARTTMGSNCSSGWVIGECGYGVDGKAAGRYLRMVYRGAPWIIWTSNRLDVITEAEGYGTGGAGTTIGGRDLLQYWSRGLANPV